MTVKRSASYEPISKISGGRRYSFYTTGQRVLFYRLHADNGRHDFVTGSRVFGPNVFSRCQATNAHSDTGPHHRYSVGLLFDNVHAGQSRVWDRACSGSGHGWSGAAVVWWNGEADGDRMAGGREGNLRIDSPPIVGAYNYAIGTSTQLLTGGTGVIDSLNVPVSPASLFEAQTAAKHAAAINTTNANTNTNITTTNNATIVTISPTTTTIDTATSESPPFTVNVSSAQALLSTVASARAGDVIGVEAGHYLLPRDLDITTNGITVIAVEPGE